MLKRNIYQNANCTILIEFESVEDSPLKNKFLPLNPKDNWW